MEGREISRFPQREAATEESAPIAAVLAALAPRIYTAVVRGKDNTTGIAVVQAYNLQ